MDPNNANSNIALLFLNIKSISGGGGAERQFTDFFIHYNAQQENKYKLYYILDRRSFDELKKIGLDKSENVILFPGGFTAFLPKKLLLYLVWNICLPYYIFKYKIRLVHFPSAVISLIPSLTILNWLNIIGAHKLSVVLNICNCYFAHDYFLDANHMYKEYLKRTRFFLKAVKLDGIFSWYQYFVDRSSEMNISGNPIIKAAQYYFVNSAFQPADKTNIVIYAGRMTKWKNPQLFVECVSNLFDNHEKYLTENDWKFEMYGDGPEASNIDRMIEKYNLQHILQRKISYRLVDEFASSRIFVSTQKFENFTSLSLLEAMSAGNAILALDVGETKRIVKDELNGYLFEDSVEGLSKKLLALIKNPEKVQEFAVENRKVATEIQTVENFIYDIENFWNIIITQENPIQA